MNPVLLLGMIKICFVLILITVAFLLTRREILTLFSTYSIQSFFLAMVAFLLYFKEKSDILLWLGFLTIISKVWIIPSVLHKVHQKMNIRRDIEFHYLSPTSSIFVSIGLILIIYEVFSTVLKELELNPLFLLGAVLGVSLLLMGMLIIFSRKKAITKVVGYLTMENGVLLFSLFLTELPFIIEVLVVIDLLMLIALATLLSFGMDSTIEEFHQRINPFRGWFKKSEFSFKKGEQR